MLGTRASDTIRDRLAKRMAKEYNIKWKLDSIPSAEFPYDVIQTSLFTFVKGGQDDIFPIYKQYGTRYIGSIFVTRIRLDEERKKAYLAMVINGGTIYSLYIVYNSKLKEWRISESEILGFFLNISRRDPFGINTFKALSYKVIEVSYMKPYISL